MSAPPIAAVVVTPFKKLSVVFAARHPAATRGTEGAIVTKAAMVNALAPKSDELIM